MLTLPNKVDVKQILEAFAFTRESALLTILFRLGGSPGIVVMEGDSCSKGRGFKNPAAYTGWTFFHIYLL